MTVLFLRLVPVEEPGYFRLCYRGLNFLATSACTTTSSLAESDPISAAGLESRPSTTPSIITDVASADEEKLIVRRVFIFAGQDLENIK